MARRYVFAVGLILAAGCDRSASESSTSVDPDAARGRLLSLNRRLLPGSQVRITGCPDQVTASDGTFDTRCAARPYDLAATAGSVGIVYQGLTRPDPVVTIPVVLSADGSSFIHGNVLARTGATQASRSRRPQRPRG